MYNDLDSKLNFQTMGTSKRIDYFTYNTALFLKDCKIQDPITIVVCDNRQSFYRKEFGKLIDEDKSKNVKGEFLPTKNIFAIYANEHKISDTEYSKYNLDKNSVIPPEIKNHFKQMITNDFYATIRHELFGHYGLSTFSPQDKATLLESVYKTKSSSDPKFQALWKEIEKNYPTATPAVQAEEVFALVAQDPDVFKLSAFEKVREFLTKCLRSVGLKENIMTPSELYNEAKKLAEGIKSGERRQQKDAHKNDLLDSNGQSIFKSPQANIAKAPNKDDDSSFKLVQNSASSSPRLPKVAPRRARA